MRSSGTGTVDSSDLPDVGRPAAREVQPASQDLIATLSIPGTGMQAAIRGADSAVEYSTGTISPLAPLTEPSPANMLPLLIASPGRRCFHCREQMACIGDAARFQLVDVAGRWKSVTYMLPVVPTWPFL